MDRSAALAILGTAIRQDAEGRFCLNDCHKAAGGENRHRPSLWAGNQQTEALIAELEGEAGIPALVSTRGGTESGTYAAREAPAIPDAAVLTLADQFMALQVRLDALAGKQVPDEELDGVTAPQASILDAMSEHTVATPAGHRARARVIAAWFKHHRQQRRRAHD